MMPSFNADSPFRVGLVFTGSMIACFMIGEHFNKPVEGMVAGMCVAALLNGAIDYQSAQPSNAAPSGL